MLNQDGDVGRLGIRDHAGDWGPGTSDCIANRFDRLAWRIQEPLGKSSRLGHVGMLGNLLECCRELRNAHGGLNALSRCETIRKRREGLAGMREAFAGGWGGFASTCEGLGIFHQASVSGILEVRMLEGRSKAIKSRYEGNRKHSGTP